jgi:hypothetical protein
MLTPFGQAYHTQQLFGPRFRLKAGQATQHLWNHDILKGREFRQQTMKLKHESDMASAKTPTLAAAKDACGCAIDNDVAGAWPLK